MAQNRSVLEATQGYQFTAQNDSYSHLLLCKICKKLMIEPSRLYPCGHTFCKSCILSHNKNISQTSQTTRQNKCFIPFPQCGKYYITLQPDLLAASLINDLPVKCLNQGCPWTGTLQRFKISHKSLCKFKQGGLSTWLNDLNQDIKSIKKIRNERKINDCIEINENDEVEVLQQHQQNNNFQGERTNKTVQSLIVASDQSPLKKCDDNSDKPVQVNEFQITKNSGQNSKQDKFILGLNKNKVGDKRKHKKSNLLQNIVDLDDDDFAVQEKKSTKTLQSLNNKQKKSPIKLDGNLDADQTQVQKSNNSTSKQSTNKVNKSLQSEKEIKQHYTGLKMINSYKKKSQRIAQNPHNMNLTRSQPSFRQEEDQYEAHL